MHPVASIGSPSSPNIQVVINIQFSGQSLDHSESIGAPSKGEIEKLIDNKKRRLFRLKERLALEGRSVDPKVPLEIEDISKEIVELQSILG